MSVTIKGEAGSIVSSVRMEDFEGPHGRVTVWNRGQNAGTLTVAKDDAVKLAYRLLGPNAHEHLEAGSIIDRCVSLVQSIAKHGYPETRDQVDEFIDEAAAIVVDAKAAGWM
jgi:hypothetical protein